MILSMPDRLPAPADCVFAVEDWNLLRSFGKDLQAPHLFGESLHVCRHGGIKSRAIVQDLALPPDAKDINTAASLTDASSKAVQASRFAIHTDEPRLEELDPHR